MMLRRDFIQMMLSAVAGATLFEGCRQRPSVKGQIIGASSSYGHLLRNPPRINTISSERRLKHLIVGGGVSGLSAAYHLSREGAGDWALLELEQSVGGNARFGENEVSAYPWGAHYVPIPGPGQPEYLKFLEEAGVITGYDVRGVPLYNEYHLCADPEERLYLNGKWQEGLVPDHGLQDQEKKEIRRFLDRMDEFRQLKGKDGKDVFSIPVDRSSTDASFLFLDEVTMAQWMENEGFHALPLKVYVDYCCRDDFGCSVGEISAWAGIHYFAARKGVAANAEAQDVLTWPEGNGFLVKALKQGLEPRVHTGAVVISVKPVEQGVEVVYLQAPDLSAHRILAEKCILATPSYVTARLLQDDTRMQLVKQNFHYTPWVVINMKVREFAERSGQEMCWDNVVHGSQALGYVVANHNKLERHQPFRNISMYLPYPVGDPRKIREQLSGVAHGQWVDKLVEELVTVHPNIREALMEVNVMVWGHAMCQPRPGIIKGKVRVALREPVDGKIFFAHTDLAGISIFEEGFYQGLWAARQILTS